jgi:hypothetical protein
MGTPVGVPSLFRNTLFAVTQDGRLVAFDPNLGGQGVIAFDTGNETQSISVVGSQTTLTGNVAAVTSGTTGTITVASVANLPVAGLPASPFEIQIGGELMTVTSRAGLTLTVTRGVHGTIGAAHATGDGVFLKGGFFSLTFDDGTTLQTTAPLAFNSPDVTSTDEIQTVDVLSYADGAPTYTLSFVDNRYHTSTLTGALDMTAADLSFTVQNGASFPASNFIVRIDDEEIFVTSRVGNTFNVGLLANRGIHGTTRASHFAVTATGTANPPATVVEVLTTTLDAAVPVTTTT